MSLTRKLCAQARQQRVSKARQLYRRALAQDPADLRCLNGLGALEARAGNYAAALK